MVFALLQLPRVVDDWFERLAPHVSGMGVPRLGFGYSIGNMVLYALIGAFIVHLAARAYRVGLVGLDTVFPDGVRWEHTHLGPYARERRDAGDAVHPLLGGALR